MGHRRETRKAAARVLIGPLELRRLLRMNNLEVRRLGWNLFRSDAPTLGPKSYSGDVDC